MDKKRCHHNNGKHNIQSIFWRLVRQNMNNKQIIIQLQVRCRNTELLKNSVFEEQPVKKYTPQLIIHILLDVINKCTISIDY